MLDLFDHNAPLPDKIHIRVTSNAAQERVKIERREDGTKWYRVYVTAIAEKGKANAAVKKLIAKELGIPVSRIEIAHGEFVKDKVIRILSV